MIPECWIVESLNLGIAPYYPVRKSKHNNWFQKFHTEGAKVEKVDGLEMVEEMAKNVGIMMQHKIDAIKVRDLSRGHT